jgi:hypothetical protein
MNRGFRRGLHPTARGVKGTGLDLVLGPLVCGL